MTHGGAIYFMASNNNKALYLGVTNNLARRVAEHKAEVNKGFTRKYHCHKLVYWEGFGTIEEAIAREKRLKNWYREWKNQLIVGKNPQWDDLSETIGVNEQVVDAIKTEYARKKEE